MAADRLRTRWDKLGREEIRRLQEQKLHRYLRGQVVPFSAYYRDLFKREGIPADGIRTLADLQQIPFTSKPDLLTTAEHPDRMRDFILMPEEAVLRRQPRTFWRGLIYGRARVKEELAYEYRPVFLTSTTGRSAEPVPFLYTRYDLDLLQSAGRRLVPVLGAPPDARLLNMFPYAPHLAFWQTHYAVTTYGSMTISSGGGKVMGTEGNIRLMEKLKPDALIGMPTFLYHVLQQALEEGKRFTELKTLVLGGEKVPSGMRLKLRDLAEQVGSPGVRVVATYGFTEARTAWGECPYDLDGESAGYHLYPDLGLFEIIDPKTGKVLADEQPGELVYTPLDGRGSIVVRYRTGDRISGGLTYEPCPHCGRRMPRLVGDISRDSEMKEMRLAKLKGTLIDFNELEHALDDEEDVGAWQIELRKINDDPMELDELLLHVVKTGSVGEDVLVKRLTQVLAKGFEVRPNDIFFHTAEQMRELQGIGTELKAKRLVDHRAVAGEAQPPPRFSGGSPARGRE